MALFSGIMSLGRVAGTALGEAVPRSASEPLKRGLIAAIAAPLLFESPTLQLGALGAAAGSPFGLLGGVVGGGLGAAAGWDADRALPAAGGAALGYGISGPAGIVPGAIAGAIAQPAVE